MKKRHVYEVGDGATEVMAPENAAEELRAARRILEGIALGEEAWRRVTLADLPRARSNAAAIGRALERIKRRLGVGEGL